MKHAIQKQFREEIRQKSCICSPLTPLAPNPQVPLLRVLAYLKSHTAIRQKAAHFLELTRIQTRVTGRKI